jgi:hypothetical protein
MRKKSLIETNPYLKDPVQRQSLLWTAVSSSSTIEGARPFFTQTSAAPEVVDTAIIPQRPEASYGPRR